MAMVRFDPYRELETLQSRMNHPFGNFYLRDEFYPRDEDVSQRGTWVCRPWISTRPAATTSSSRRNCPI